MFIVNLTYKTDLDKVDQYLNQHIDFLDQQYKEGYFLASGRKVPRNGGIILARAKNKTELLGIIEKDPFKIHGLADYEFTEFVPSKTSERLAYLKDS